MTTLANETAPIHTPDVCEDCGAIVAEGRAGCLKLFEEILAREFSDFHYGRAHRLTVDAYALQHPDRYMRSGKSFAAHLNGYVRRARTWGRCCLEPGGAEVAEREPAD